MLKKIRSTQRALSPNRPSYKLQVIGLIIGLILFTTILNGFFITNSAALQKNKIIYADNEKEVYQVSYKAEDLNSETISFQDEFQKLSGVAKIVILTIHAPWAFKNTEKDN
jgi:hypothetical protein